MYERLLYEAAHQGVDVYEKPLRKRNKGFYADNVIWINSNQTTIEKSCTLAEELGHYHTSIGDIIDQTKITNRKQERRAREWAHRHLIPLKRIVEAHRAKVSGRHDLAEYLGVTEQFLQEAIDRYKDKYGLYAKVDDRYTIIFEPLSVIELFGE